MWSTVFDTSPPGLVRRSVHREGWIPFATTTGGDYLAVDMDPGPAGRPGQVIRIGHRINGATYVADSITTLVRRHVEALDRRDHTFDPDVEGLEIDAGLPGELHVSTLQRRPWTDVRIATAGTSMVFQVSKLDVS